MAERIECENCGGVGEADYRETDYGRLRHAFCDDCNGKGYIEPEEEDDDEPAVPINHPGYAGGRDT